MTRCWPYVLLGGFWLLMLADVIVRGLALAFSPAKTDFTELYVSAWLWRHGLNFYDSALVTSTAPSLTGTQMILAPIYPPTTLIAVAPFTFLPWGWANFLWLLMCLTGVAITIVLLIQLSRFSFRDHSALYLITAVLAFSPMHQAFHLGNIVLLVAPLVLVGIYFAEQNTFFAAGLILGFATLLKPQVGIWVLLFYAVNLRKKFLAGVALPAIAFALPLLWHPFTSADLISYRQNLDHWFAPGKPYGFTEGALAYHVNVVQVLVYRAWKSVAGAKLIAHVLFASGLAIWAVPFWRHRFRIPAPLAISSLLGLSFVSLYHSVADATILLLALCWALPRRDVPWTWLQRLTCAVVILMLLPGHSALMRLGDFNPTVTQTWWWNLFVGRYFVWLLLAFNAALLRAMWTAPAQAQLAARSISPIESVAA